MTGTRTSCMRWGYVTRSMFQRFSLRIGSDRALKTNIRSTSGTFITSTTTALRAESNVPRPGRLISDVRRAVCAEKVTSGLSWPYDPVPSHVVGEGFRALHARPVIRELVSMGLAMPLAQADTHLLQVLLSSATLSRKSADGVRLSVAFDDETPAVWRRKRRRRPLLAFRISVNAPPLCSRRLTRSCSEVKRDQSEWRATTFRSAMRTAVCCRWFESTAVGAMRCSIGTSVLSAGTSLTGARTRAKTLRSGSDHRTRVSENSSLLMSNVTFVTSSQPIKTACRPRPDHPETVHAWQLWARVLAQQPEALRMSQQTWPAIRSASVRYMGQT